MNRTLSLYTRIVGGVLLLMALLLNSCMRTDRLDDSPTRTVLVYMSAYNNLDQMGYANTNIRQMGLSLSNGRIMDHSNLLVFCHRKYGPSTLMHIEGYNKVDTIRVYDSVNSCDPAVLNEVIRYVKDEWPAEVYGMIMWSHGTGWLPKDKLHYIAPNLKYAPSRDGNSIVGGTVIGQISEPMTKAFAMNDVPKGQNPPYDCMELDEMVGAIPDGFFDYIAFDACYMGCVEVAYALRHKCNYMISSPYEILANGYPYSIVTRDFLNGNLLKACREFYEHYSTMGDRTLRMAGISLVKTDGLDSLARCFRKITADFRDSIARMDTRKLQRYDTFDNHVMFDIQDYIDKLGPRKEYKDEFALQLNRCVLYKISTQYVFPCDDKEIEIKTFSGLSAYIPISKYESPGLNADYRKTEWGKATSFY